MTVVQESLVAAFMPRDGSGTEGICLISSLCEACPKRDRHSAEEKENSFSSDLRFSFGTLSPSQKQTQNVHIKGRFHASKRYI